MADDAPWFTDGDDSATNDFGAADDTSGGGGGGGSGGAVGDAAAAISSIPSGPPVPNPYAHILRIPTVGRRFEHWARSKHLQYHYNEEYARLYYDDCIDYMDKRLKGVYRDMPRPQEWPERVLRLYAREGERLSANDWKYWWTDANNKKPMPQVFHAVHSKESTFRQYRNTLC